MEVFFFWIKIFLLLDQVEAKEIFPGPKKNLKSFNLSFLKPKQTAKEEFGLEEFCSLPAVSNNVCVCTNVYIYIYIFIYLFFPPPIFSADLPKMCLVQAVAKWCGSYGMLSGGMKLVIFPHFLGTWGCEGISQEFRIH